MTNNEQVVSSNEWVRQRSPQRTMGGERKRESAARRTSTNVGRKRMNDEESPNGGEKSDDETHDRDT
jgi:hypothetical protein